MPGDPRSPGLPCIRARDVAPVIAMSLGRDGLLDRVYNDYRDISERTIDHHIKNLRGTIDFVLPNRFVIEWPSHDIALPDCFPSAA